MALFDYVSVHISADARNINDLRYFIPIIRWKTAKSLCLNPIFLWNNVWFLATFEFFEIFEFTLNCHECQSNYIQNLSWQAIKLCTCMVNSDNIANSSLYLIVLISYFIKEYLSMSMSTFPRFSSRHFFSLFSQELSYIPNLDGSANLGLKQNLVLSCSISNLERRSWESNLADGRLYAVPKHVLN